MFKAYCPRHGHDVLLGYNRLRRLVNVKPGVIVLVLACHDGEVVHVVTGANAPAPTATSSAAAA